jgi:N-acetylmuramoyl-L-alanine amidase
MRPVAGLLPALLLLGACGRPGSEVRSGPEPQPGAPVAASSEELGDAAPLPEIPLVRGALAPRVVYPAPNALVAARDSNFIFGSTGSGDASLAINGIPVEVKPNGAFLAWLPVPRQPRYELVVTRGAEQARLTHPVTLLPTRQTMSIDEPLRVDSASLLPVSGLSMRPDEPVRVSVRATGDARVALETRGGARVGLTRGPIRGADGAIFDVEVPASRLAAPARLLVERNRERITLEVPQVSLADTGEARLVQVGQPTTDPDPVVNARPSPGGTYRWLLLPGTTVAVTGTSGSFSRVRFDSALEAWVNTADVVPLPSGTLRPRRVAGNLVVRPDTHWVDVVFPIESRPAFHVEEQGSALVLTMYDVVSNTDIVTFSRADGLVRHVTWDQVASDRARYTIQLAHEPFGYLAMWQEGRFVLRIRRRPSVDADQPLRGLRIAVDAGHPPIGATGPTGLYEGDATLAISRHLERMLRERGAEVVMTRTTPDAVPLGDRPRIARAADAHALVSIHLNALPDGVNPFTAHGTGTYYFHPHSEPLARTVQRGMVRHMGLRNLGVYYDNLALVRPTWMPSVLCEGAFLMIPEQEAALRTSEFQERYARGVADGLEEYFRRLAAAP